MLTGYWTHNSLVTIFLKWLIIVSCVKDIWDAFRPLTSGGGLWNNVGKTTSILAMDSCLWRCWPHTKCALLHKDTGYIADKTMYLPSQYSSHLTVIKNHKCDITTTSISSQPMQIMMTSSNGNIFRVTGHLCGEFTGPRWIPTQRPLARSFDCFFDLRLNKRLSKQS